MLANRSPALLLLTLEMPGTRANWKMERAKPALSSLKFAACTVFGSDLNGGEDGDWVAVCPGMALCCLFA